MLFALRDYILKEKSASLEQLTRFFNADATALLPMLDVWIARGVILRHQHVKTPCASACQGCHVLSTPTIFSVPIS